MSQTFDPRGDEHAQVWAAIPWCVSGSVGADELARALRHIGQCADCRAEWEWNERIRAGLKVDRPTLDTTEDSLQALWRRIDGDVDDGAAPAEAWPRNPARGPRWLHWLAAASVLQAVALAALAALWWNSAGDARYETLGRESAVPASAPPSAASAPRLQLQLTPAATPQQVDALADRLRQDPLVHGVEAVTSAR